MSERFSRRTFANNEHIKKLRGISDHAINVVDRTYGSGYPMWDAGETELAFHNGHHGRSVGQKSVRLCVALGFEPVLQALAEASGRAHDIVQLKGRGIDESESAQWLDAKLEAQGFDQTHRGMARLAILGTQPLFKGSQFVEQLAVGQEYPSKIAELFAKSVASADLGELYTPEGPYLGHQLLREIKGMSDAIPMDELINFQRNNQKFLEEYEYPLPLGETLFTSHKAEVIKYSQSTLDALEQGSVESLDDLLRRDLAFSARHQS